MAVRGMGGNGRVDTQDCRSMHQRFTKMLIC